MLFYSNLNSKKYCKVGLLKFLLFLKDDCSEDFLEKIYSTCNLALFRKIEFRGIMLPAWIQEYWFIIPRNEQYFDEMVLLWHKKLDNCCLKRNYVYTDEQSELSLKMSSFPSVSSAQITKIFEAVIKAKEQGIQNHNEEMYEALEPVIIESKRAELNEKLQMEQLQKEIDKLEPEEDEKIYTDKFLRSIDPEKFKLITPFSSMLQVLNIFIDLFPYSEFLSQQTGANSWSVQIKKNLLRLKFTRKPYKHNKSLCYL